MKILVIPISLIKKVGVLGIWKKPLYAGITAHKYRNFLNMPFQRAIFENRLVFTHAKIVLLRVVSSATSTNPSNPSEEIAKDIEAAKVEQEIQPKPAIHNDVYFDKDIWRKIKKKQTEQYYFYTGNNFIDQVNAKKDYLLDDKDLMKLLKMRRKSPYCSSKPEDENLNYIDIYFTKDVEKLATDKWGSVENITKEKQIRKYIAFGGIHQNGDVLNWGHLDVQLSKTMSATPLQPWLIALPNGRILAAQCNCMIALGETEDALTEMSLSRTKAILQAFGHGSGAVVAFAFLMNLSIAGLKGVVWYFTHSPSMFSEFMHSFMDCSNQLLLGIGRYLSLKKPDSSHPYGYRNHLHIFPIASGVFIFSFGCGLTLYHSIQGFLYPELLDWTSLYRSLMMLAGSFAAESASLIFAINHTWLDAKRLNMSFLKYVREHENPLVNVVLLEDMVAVVGVIVCGSAMGCSYLFSMPWIDATGSLIISAMLGFVSVSLFRTNADKLLGKSLPYENQIKKNMESDRFVQAVLDNKTIDMGDQSRFKSEVVLDAKLITQHFLGTEVDIDAMLVKFRSVKTSEDMERFLEEFGVQIYEQIVAQVDRLEQDIKKKFPEIRHVDIEPS